MKSVASSRAPAPERATSSPSIGSDDVHPLGRHRRARPIHRAVAAPAHRPAAFANTAAHGRGLAPRAGAAATRRNPRTARQLRQRRCAPPRERPLDDDELADQQADRPPVADDVMEGQRRAPTPGPLNRTARMNGSAREVEQPCVLPDSASAHLRGQCGPAAAPGRSTMRTATSARGQSPGTRRHPSSGTWSATPRAYGRSRSGSPRSDAGFDRHAWKRINVVSLYRRLSGIRPIEDPHALLRERHLPAAAVLAATGLGSGPLRPASSLSRNLALARRRQSGHAPLPHRPRFVRRGAHVGFVRASARAARPRACGTGRSDSSTGPARMSS